MKRIGSQLTDARTSNPEFACQFRGCPAVNELTKNHFTLATRKRVDRLTQIQKEFCSLKDFSDIELCAIDKVLAPEQRFAVSERFLIKSTNGADFEKRFDFLDLLA